MNETHLSSRCTLTPFPPISPWYDGNGNVMGWVENEPGYTLPLWRMEYDPYGKLLVEDPVRVARHQKHRTLGIEEKWLHRPPVGFSTKYEDAETGLLYYGYRYYNPELGRWLNRDPIWERGGINLYGMVSNDPVNKVDVLGLAETTMPAKPPNCIVKLRQMHGPDGARTYHTEYERSVDAMATAAGWSAGLHQAGIIGYPSFYGRLSLLSCEYAPAAGARFLIPGIKGSPAGSVGYSNSGTDTNPGGLAGRNFSNGGHGPFIEDYAAYVNESWQAALKEGNSLADNCGKDQCCACQEITVIFEAAADDHHRAWNNQPTLPYYNDFLDTPMAQHMNSSSTTIGNSGLPNIVDPNPKAGLPTKVPNIPKSGQSFKFKVKR